MESVGPLKEEANVHKRIENLSQKNPGLVIWRGFTVLQEETTRLITFVELYAIMLQLVSPNQQKQTGVDLSKPMQNENYALGLSKQMSDLIFRK